MEQYVSHAKQQVQKPKLEIPDSSSKLAGNGSSPRDMHGFPQSPQGLELISPVSSHLKTFEEWTTQSAPVSPATRVTDDTELKKTSFYVGEYVLVRCNQSKWLLGQVRRSSKTGVRIWVGAAQTLVNVPFVLLASHIVKLDSPSLPTCPSSTLSLESLEVGRHGQILAPFQCVRPAHLSHRKLFQPLGLLPKEKSEGVDKVRTVQFDSEHPLHAVCGPTLKDMINVQDNKLNKDLILQYKYNGRGCLGILASSTLPAYVPASFKEDLAAKGFTTESYYGVPVLRGRVVAGQPSVMSTLGHPALPENTSNPVQEPVSGPYILCKFKFPEDPSSDSIANVTKNLHSSGTSSQIVDKHRFRNECHFSRNSSPQAEKRETWGAGGMGKHEQEEACSFLPGGKTHALENESECTWIAVIQNGLNVRKKQPENCKL